MRSTSEMREIYRFLAAPKENKARELFDLLDKLSEMYCSQKTLSSDESLSMFYDYVLMSCTLEESRDLCLAFLHPIDSTSALVKLFALFAQVKLRKEKNQLVDVLERLIEKCLLCYCAFDNSADYFYLIERCFTQNKQWMSGSFPRLLKHVICLDAVSNEKLESLRNYLLCKLPAAYQDLFRYAKNYKEELIETNNLDITTIPCWMRLLCCCICDSAQHEKGGDILFWKSSGVIADNICEHSLYAQLIVFLSRQSLCVIGATPLVNPQKVSQALGAQTAPRKLTGCLAELSRRVLEKEGCKIHRREESDSYEELAAPVSRR